MIHPEIWIEAWRQRTLGLLNRGLDVVVDDLRFPNEAYAVRAMGGKIVEIIGRDKGLGKKHQSENGVGEPDMQITNVVSLEQFQQDIVYVFSRMDVGDLEPDDESA